MVVKRAFEIVGKKAFEIVPRQTVGIIKMCDPELSSVGLLAQPMEGDQMWKMVHQKHWK